MQIAKRPIIAVRLERVTSWGNLSVGAHEADHDGRAYRAGQRMWAGALKKLNSCLTGECRTLGGSSVFR